MSLRKVKKQISKLYLITNSKFNNNCFEINFNNSFGWHFYFSLNRTIHEVIIKYQYCSYLDKVSYNGIFLVEKIPENKQITNIIFLSDVKDLLKFIQKIKQNLTKNYSIQYEYWLTLQEMNGKNEHIENCVKKDDLYKLTCVRQTKSTTNRRIKRITDQYEKNPINVANADDAINYFFEQIQSLEWPDLTNIFSINSPGPMKEETLDELPEEELSLTTG